MQTLIDLTTSSYRLFYKTLNSKSLFFFLVLSSSLGEDIPALNETISTNLAQYITNVSTTPPLDLSSTCGVNFCSSSAPHVSNSFGCN